MRHADVLSLYRSSLAQDGFEAPLQWWSVHAPLPSMGSLICEILSDASRKSTTTYTTCCYREVHLWVLQAPARFVHGSTFLADLIAVPAMKSNASSSSGKANFICCRESSPRFDFLKRYTCSPKPECYVCHVNMQPVRRRRVGPNAAQLASRLFEAARLYPRLRGQEALHGELLQLKGLAERWHRCQCGTPPLLGCQQLSDVNFR